MTIPKDWMPAASMARIIVHWTGGGHRATALDREHYHLIVEADGKLVRGIPTIAQNEVKGTPSYAAHTLGCNTGSIGISMACMAGAIERPFDAGTAPMTRTQWDAMIQAVADLCSRYGIPVTARTVLTHAEVQGTLGIKQRGKWDITRLAFDPTTVGAKACGDRLRSEVVAVHGARRAEANDPDAPSKPVAPAPPAPKPALSRILKRGLSGLDVLSWQRDLHTEGFTVDLDGIFGPGTEGATRNLQERLGLAVDGRVGLKTVRALAEFRARRAAH